MTKNQNLFLLCILTAGITAIGCKSWSKTQKGAAVGTVGGGAVGAVVGKTLGNTALGAIIGAAVGGVTGAVIGSKMDKQAEELKKKVPGATVTRVGEGIEVEFSEKILFGFDQSVLSTAAKSTLEKAVMVMNDFPDTDIEVQGHTDNTGSSAYNQDLSLRRANAVLSYLNTSGILLKRMKAVGYGEGYPKYSNDSDDGRSINRRVEFLITANEKMKADAKIEAAKK